MAVTIAHTLEFLIGDWSIERTIDDRHADTRIRFSGTATVTSHGPDAVYAEVGEVTVSGHAGPARRTLLLTALEAEGVRLDFQDGRPFIDLDLTSGHASATHPCRADLYEMTFEVLAADALLETWRVRGPEKNYTARTVWRRQR